MSETASFNPATEMMTIVFDPADLPLEDFRRMVAEVRRMREHSFGYRVNGAVFDDYEPAMAHVLDLLKPRIEAYKQAQLTKQGAWRRVYPELAACVDLVPTQWLHRLRGNDLRHDVTELMADIEQNGMRSPVRITVGQHDRYARVGEGNHRIEVALKLGLELIPAFVLVYRNGHIRGHGQHCYKVEHDLLIPAEGYLPAEMKPSQVFKSLMPSPDLALPAVNVRPYQPPGPR